MQRTILIILYYSQSLYRAFIFLHSTDVGWWVSGSGFPSPPRCSHDVLQCGILANPVSFQCWIQGLMARGQGQGLEVQGQEQGQGLVNWSSRTRTIKDFPGDIYQKVKYMTSISKTFFTVSSCSVVSGSNRIYGCHMIIHNGLFAECEVLENFQGLCGPRTRTRTYKLVLEDKDFPRGLQHCEFYKGGRVATALSPLLTGFARIPQVPWVGDGASKPLELRVQCCNCSDNLSERQN